MDTVCSRIYGMWIVSSYDDQMPKENLIFSGFNGIIVYDSGHAKVWNIIEGAHNKCGNYETRNLGAIDCVIPSMYSGKEVADFIKAQVSTITGNPSIPVAVDESIAKIIHERDVSFVNETKFLIMSEERG